MTSLSINICAVPGPTVLVNCASSKETRFGHVGPDSPAFKVD